MSTKTVSIVSWLLRGIAALILLQTLFFKFTAAPESVYIFSKLGMEPWGRVGSGIAELIASLLILIPRTTWIGALLATGIMAGAIYFHLTSLGIEVQGDGGQLFVYALIVLICSILLLLLDKEKLRYWLHMLPGKSARAR